MKKITKEKIQLAVKKLVIQANTQLRPDVLKVLEAVLKQEKKAKARTAISAIIENAEIAKKKKIAICQDTGMPVIFVSLGDQVSVEGNITEIIIDAVKKSYKQEYLRASIQPDPLFRSKSPSYAPCIIHVDIVKGNKCILEILPKGFGCENKAQVKMFNPTVSLTEVQDFIVETVRQAGASACPPYMIGIGVGGTQDYAGLLAKKALLRPVDKSNKDKKLAKLETIILKKINKLKIGPFGLGGNATALSVAIKTYSTHIAGMPVAVNISCHALRSARIIL